MAYSLNTKLTRPAYKIVGLAPLVFLLCLCWILPASAAAQPAFRGVQVHSLWYERSTTEMKRELDLTQQLGSNVVRVDVGWSSLETDGKGDYTAWYLEKLDRFVREAGEHGLKVIATLVSTPCWASSAPESLKEGCSGRWWDRGVQNYPPTNASDFADAARFVAARYGTALAAIEVWNEPNLERFLVAPDRAGAYAALVRAAYPAVKAGNANVGVLAGAIAAADRPFLDELYARGIKGSYDGISIHPYNEWRDPYDRWQAQWKKYTFLPGIEWIRESQAAAGDSTPLWITEFGWDTCTGSAWCVDETRQADYLVKAWKILNTSAFSYVQGATMYELRDESTDLSDFEGNWGLLHQDFSPKPAFAAVEAALHAAPEAEVGSTVEENVTLKIGVEDSGAVYAIGHAPPNRTLKTHVSKCQANVAQRLLRSNRRGVYRRKMGSIRKLKGCRVTVKLKRSSRTATRTVPHGIRLFVDAARTAS